MTHRAWNHTWNLFNIFKSYHHIQSFASAPFEDLCWRLENLHQVVDLSICTAPWAIWCYTLTHLLFPTQRMFCSKHRCRKKCMKGFRLLPAEKNHEGTQIMRLCSAMQVVWLVNCGFLLTNCEKTLLSFLSPLASTSIPNPFIKQLLIEDELTICEAWR